MHVILNRYYKPYMCLCSENMGIQYALYLIVAGIETKSGLIKQRYVKCLLCLPHKTT